MSNRVGVFVDLSNQFYCVNKRWAGRKIDFRKYLELATEGKEIHRAIAFGTQVDGSASKFITCLQHIGFVPHYRDITRGAWYDWSVGISVELFRHYLKLDEVVLGSSSMTMAPIVSWLREHGVIVTIIGCGISRELKDAADKYIEISENILEGSDVATEAA